MNALGNHANSIRSARLADVDELSLMMAEDYTESGYQYDMGIARDAFRQLISKPSLGRVWILQRGTRTAGYIVLTYSFSLEYGGRDALADDLYVRKEFRHLGLGRLGMQTLIDECKMQDVRMVNLEVEPRNTGARRLYYGLGFRDNRRRLMRLRLI